MVASAQLPLLDESILYNAAHSDATAYFGALILMDGGKKIHDCYPVEHLPYWLKAIDRTRDSYVSQAQFARKRRLISSLLSIGLVWADLGDDGVLGENGDAAAVNRILWACEDAPIPPPSLIVGSGRGYHAKWLFEKGLTRDELDRWSGVERTLVSILREPLYADLLAQDAARVLRVIDTRNTKTDTLARIAWANTYGGDVVRYDFDLLEDEILPLQRQSDRRDDTRILVPHRKAGLHVPGMGLSRGMKIWWPRLRDIRRLCVLRGWTPDRGGVPKGYRDIILFLCAVALSWIARPATWWAEVQSVAAELTPSLRGPEWRTYVGTAYRRLIASSETDKPESRYQYKTSTIVSMLDISRDEMIAGTLETLLAEDMLHANDLATRRLRDEKRHRAKGMVERGTYLATAEERAREARRLIAQGLSQREVAEKLGVSRRVVQYALQGNSLSYAS